MASSDMLGTAMANAPIQAAYFDTAILRQAPFGALKRVIQPLVDAKTPNAVELFVPETALRELAAYHVRAVADLRAKLSDATKKLKNYGKEESTEPRRKDEDLEAELTRSLSKELADAGVAIVPTPELSVATLLEMALAKEAPFDEQGRGFRDAVILMTVSAHAKRFAGSTVVLVSPDSDFSDAALARWGREAGVSIERAKDLSQAVKLVNQKFFDSYRERMRLLQEKALPLLEAARDQVLAILSQNLRPRAELLNNDASENEHRLFWSVRTIESLVGYHFGKFGYGSVFSPLLFVQLEDGRIALEFIVETDFDVRVSMPASLEGPRFELPEETSPGRQVWKAERTFHEVVLKRPIRFVVSFQTRPGPELTDWRVESCDGEKVLSES